MAAMDDEQETHNRLLDNIETGGTAAAIFIVVPCWNKHLQVRPNPTLGTAMTRGADKEVDKKETVEESAVVIIWLAVTIYFWKSSLSDGIKNNSNRGEKR